MNIEHILQKEVREPKMWLNLESYHNSQKEPLVMNWIDKPTPDNTNKTNIQNNKICHLIEFKISEIILKINRL
jgi:hypothetical protein